MATITLTSGYAELDNWPGNLFDAQNGATVITKTATTFAYECDPSHEFPGFTITISGTGFTYDGNEPLTGTMTSVTIRDENGNTVLTISGLAAGTPASDLNLFYANIFGWEFPDGGTSGTQAKNAWSQLLSGNDTVNGTSGDDYRGSPGVDAGNDVFNMGNGDDWVAGGMGNDTIKGGNDFDTLSFEETHWNEGIPMVRGANVDMTTGVVLDPYGFKDKITGIEKIVGSSYADVFLGDDNDNTFVGARGKDTINGGGGDRDWVDYQDDTNWGATRGIVADLTAGTIKDGFGNTDTVSNIENISGTRYNDVFVGNGVMNTFVGGEGKDSYDGKGGDDFIYFFRSFTDGNEGPINVDLTKASNQIIDDGYGNTETATSIEGIIGTDFADKIKGTSGFNYFGGNDGKDTMTGGGGNDYFEYWDLDAMNDQDVITDFTSGSGGNQDVFNINMSNMGASTTLTLVNGTAATQAVSTFIFDTATDKLYWDADGTGGGARVTVAVLQGVNSLSAANFDLF